VIGAVDIGGTKIAVGMVDDVERGYQNWNPPTDARGGYANGLARLTSMLRETARNAGVGISGIKLVPRGYVPESGKFGDADFARMARKQSRGGSCRASLMDCGDLKTMGMLPRWGEASWGAGKASRA